MALTRSSLVKPGDETQVDNRMPKGEELLKEQVKYPGYFVHEVLVTFSPIKANH